MNHHCLDIKRKSPYGYGDLDDDCCAKWMELLLRAEWMYGEGLDAWWWWAIINVETGEHLDTSYLHSYRPTTGEEARKCAEAAAQHYFDSIYSSLFRHKL